MSRDSELCSSAEELNRLIAATWDMVTNDSENLPEDIARVEASACALQSQQGAIHALLLRARYEGGQDRYMEALVKANDAYTMAQKLQDNDTIIRSCRVLGFLYSQLGKYDNALRHLLDAIRRINETGIAVYEGVYPIETYLYNNVAFLYSNLDKVNEALRFFLQAYEIAKEYGGSMLVITLINVAEMHMRLGDTSMALRYSRMALEEVIEKNLGPGDQHQCYNTFGLIYTKMGMYTKALEHFRQAIGIAARSGSKSMQIVSALDLSRLYLMMDNCAMSLEVVLTVLPLAEEIQAKVSLRDIHLLLSEVYERTGQFREALEHYKKHTQLSQEVFAQESEQRLDNYEAEFRAQQAIKDAEIYRLVNIELRQNTLALQESHQNLTIISQIGQKLTSTLNAEDVLTILYENIRELMPADVFGIATYDEKARVVEYKLLLEQGQRIPLYQLKLGERASYTEQCIKRRDAVLENHVDVNASRMVGINNGQPPRAIIYCPLVFNDRTMGVMTVQSYHPDAYTEQNVSTIKTLANYTAIALNNSQKSEDLRQAAQKLEKLSKLDPLTGLYNRRHIIEQMEHERLRYLRYSTDFTTILIDIDDFKNVNDTYGHNCGDYVLVEVANRMSQMLRQQDCLSRWGGEEFLVMLPETNAEGAYILAERLRLAIQELDLSYNGATVQVTVTLGVCPFVNELTIEELIMRADRALYRGKRRGRNCVVVYDK